MTTRRAATILAVILTVTAVVAWRWWHDHPPYGPEALELTSSLSLVSNDEAQAALGENAPAPFATGRDQLVLGRVSWQTPPKPLDGGYFAIFLIDKRTDHKPEVFGVSAPQEAVGIGSAGIESRITERYSWLRGAGDATFGDDEWRSNGNRLHVADETAAPLAFVALFPYLEEPHPEASMATAPVALSDLLLAMVYLGPDGQVYWAQRLQG
ncbi:hypothetical protein ACFOOK_13865 [Micromonospora krabiensis]|uniref:Uncharacterized protein n=1 Tax=Micromonospora krabiensis TaxID=307121 RepID=A0A1C3N1L7_9ACTN|nr:hypothetical protein [Micromonospora krabiensis]SBV26477.1 hypothetical protein GA0070620_1967 [Micromonospora krabiensis]